MKKDTKRNLKLIFVGLLGVVIATVGWLFLSELIPLEGLDWRGIYIGKSREEDVIKTLGQPNSVKKGIITTTLVYEEEGAIKVNHYVMIRYGVVQVIEEDTLVNSDYMRLSLLVEQYGVPDAVEWSFEGPDRRTVIFDNGIMANVIVSQLDEAVVTKIIYHKPTPLILLQLRFMRVFSIVDPFPNSDIVGKKDPWFNTSNSCRDKCE